MSPLELLAWVLIVVGAVPIILLLHGLAVLMLLDKDYGIGVVYTSMLLLWDGVILLSML